MEVDDKLGIDAERTYFGAVALGGAGVRYYGEYCMVLRLRSWTTALVCSIATRTTSSYRPLPMRYGTDR